MDDCIFHRLTFDAKDVTQVHVGNGDTYVMLYVDHSDVVGASAVGADPTTSSFST